MSNIKLVGQGLLAQAVITSYYTNNSGAPQLIYGQISTDDGSSSVIEIGDNLGSITDATRLAALTLTVGKIISLPIFIVPAGESIVGQALVATADAFISLYNLDLVNDVNPIHFDELPISTLLIPTSFFGNSNRIIMSFNVSAIGSTEAILIQINGLIVSSLEAETGDTITVEHYMDFGDTLEITAGGAGVNANIIQIPQGINVRLTAFELV